MSVRLMEQVFRDTRIDGGSELNVMLALADEVRDGVTCWPSMETIARKARMTDRGARNVIRKLEAKGLLRRLAGGGRTICNRYVLLLNPEQVSENTATNPEPQTRNDVPSKGENPEICDHKPGTAVPPNRNEPLKAADERASASEIDQVREAAGVDPSKRLPQAWLDPWVENELGRWKALDLSLPEILTVLQAVTAKRGGAPPSSPTYFARPLQEAAGAKGAPALTPIEGGRRPADIPKIDIEAVLRKRHA